MSKLVAVTLVMLTATVFAVAASKNLPVEKGAWSMERFVAPDVCGDCHSTIHGEWSTTLHAAALRDPVYQAIAKTLAAEAKTPAEKHEAELCIKCHAPLLYGAGVMTSAEQPFAMGEKKTNSHIACDFCHSVAGLNEIRNTGHLLDPGNGEEEPGNKRGPRNDGACEYHQCEFSELHTSSAFCGGCHQVRHVDYGTPLETTYTEWLAGPYSTDDPKTTVNCQDCHMRQAPGIPATGITARPDRPGNAADDGPQRPHVWRHRTVGGNVFVPPLLGDDGTAVQMATERLQHCAAIELQAGPWTTGDVATLRVRVKNTGAGHDIPTGVTELRQVWLEIKVIDAAGKLVFVSGEESKSGFLSKDTVLYHTAMGDATGEPTFNILKADRVLFDYRIPAAGYRDEEFRFAVPKATKRPFTVTARLRYRGLPQVIINLLGDAAPPVPVVDMTTEILTVR
ncbi:MAG: multiheme c-type cytochrome [Candidatus Lernaella stagnicola]|nr:multiheme c-type cytochrome [Candidatus Lernaella stagnicola]